MACDSEDSYQNAIALLRSNRILFFPTIGERGGVVGHVLNPTSPNLSFTWNSFWGGFRLALTSLCGGLLPRMVPLGALEGLRGVISSLRIVR